MHSTLTSLCALGAALLLASRLLAHISPDGRCGHKYHGASCIGSPWGEYCSGADQCEWEPYYADLSEGCQPEYGLCAPRGSISPGGRCGGEDRYTCPGSVFGDSCSEYGYCGQENDYNYSGEGCQPAFGKCAPPPGSVSPNGRCGGRRKYTCLGSEYGDSCSQYGWCGQDEDYCGEGCQPKFGYCPVCSVYGSPTTARATATATTTVPTLVSGSTVSTVRYGFSNTTTSTTSTTITTTTTTATNTTSTQLPLSTSTYVLTSTTTSTSLTTVASTSTQGQNIAIRLLERGYGHECCGETTTLQSTVTANSTSTLTIRSPTTSVSTSFTTQPTSTSTSVSVILTTSTMTSTALTLLTLTLPANTTTTTTSTTTTTTSVNTATYTPPTCSGKVPQNSVQNSKYCYDPIGFTDRTDPFDGQQASCRQRCDMDKKCNGFVRLDGFNYYKCFFESNPVPITPATACPIAGTGVSHYIYTFEYGNRSPACINGVDVPPTITTTTTSTSI